MALVLEAIAALHEWHESRTFAGRKTTFVAWSAWNSLNAWLFPVSRGEIWNAGGQLYGDGLLGVTTRRIEAFVLEKFCLSRTCTTMKRLSYERLSFDLLSIDHRLLFTGPWICGFKPSTSRGDLAIILDNFIRQEDWTLTRRGVKASCWKGFYKDMSWVPWCPALWVFCFS